MSLIYLDQNALITLWRKAQERDFRERLDAFINSGSEVLVFSVWSLIETSYGDRPESSGELADFVESLRPSWLLERHEMLRLDVSNDFYRYLKLGANAPPRVVPQSDMFATIAQRTGGPTFRGSIRSFVALWRKRRVEAGYVESGCVTARLRDAKKRGRITAATKKQAVRNLIQSVLPKFTPLGLEIPPRTTTDYLRQVDPSTIPYVALDLAITGCEWGWQTSSGQERNTAIDKFHLLSALPYVDKIVSDDRFFHYVHDHANRTGHVRAAIMHNVEFLNTLE